MTTDELVLNELKETGALLEGHFLLSSGRHSDRYVQCARLLQYPDRAARVLAVAAEQFRPVPFDLIVGPAMGGIIVAYELARQLGKPGIFVERENSVMALRRGFVIAEGTRCIISEDVVTTGKSSEETAKVIRECGVKSSASRASSTAAPSSSSIPSGAPSASPSRPGPPTTAHCANRGSPG